MICMFYLIKYFFLKFEKNFLINAAPTPKIRANKIENKPYKIGISTDNFLINIDKGVGT